MVIYFGTLLALCLYHIRALWRERDFGGVGAVLTIGLISAAAGVWYYQTNM